MSAFLDVYFLQKLKNNKFENFHIKKLLISLTLPSFYLFLSSWNGWYINNLFLHNKLNKFRSLNNKYFISFLGDEFKTSSEFLMSLHHNEDVKQGYSHSKARLGWKNYFQPHSCGGWQGFRSSQHGPLHWAEHNTAAGFTKSISQEKKRNNWDENKNVFSNFRNDTPSLLPNSMVTKEPCTT